MNTETTSTTETSGGDLLQSFRSDGFVAIERFVNAEELAEINANLERFIKTIVPQLPPEHVFYEDKHQRETLKQIQHLGDHDPWFHQLFTSGRFRDVAELLLDGPVVPRNMQYFNKPPQASQPTPPHQDGFYFMLDPCEAVTMWFAIDDVDEENGCVRYVKGSHQHGMRKHVRTQTLGFSQGIADYPTKRDCEMEVPVPATAGDLLVHDAMTIHHADANRSETRSRRSLGFIYYSERAREDVVAHAAYQRRLANEMKESGKI